MIKIFIALTFVSIYLIGMPLLVIWSLNNLLTTNIEYNYLTWSSVLILYIVIDNLLNGSYRSRNNDK